MSDSSKEILNRMLELETENSEMKDKIRTMQLEMDKLRRRLEAPQLGYSKTL
jgi:molecular chaperone GrpE (heat shock protein)